MTFVGSSAFSATEWNSLQIRQVVLARLMIILASLHFYNFKLVPELKLKKQLATYILQVNSDLKKVKSTGVQFKKEYNFQLLLESEKALAKPLPAEWQFIKLLRWITNAIQQNGLQLEEQNFDKSTAQSLIQTLTIKLELSGKYINFQQFMQKFKERPQLLLLKKLLLENSSPAQQDQKLRIEMVLAVPRRLQILAKESNL